MVNGAPRGAKVLVVGTFDTKALELAALANGVNEAGCEVSFMDTSARLTPAPSQELLAGRCFIDQDQVAAAAELTMQEIHALPRGQAVEALRRGTGALLTELVREGAIDGVVCMGGAGTHIVGPALQRLPLGFPKLIISPLASGSRTFEPYVGIKDVAVIHSVADIIGVNSVTAEVYRTAAGFIAGAAGLWHQRSGAPVSSRATVAVSMNGNTTPALMIARDALEAAGYDFLAFHANGVGGRALEDAVASGKVSFVIDFTLTELSARVLGGLMDPGPHRLKAAGARGVPQLIVPGCVDFITTGPLKSARRDFPGREYFAHNPELTLVRLTETEMLEVAGLMAERLNAAAGPVVVYIPEMGLSVPDTPDGAFWNPEADAAFASRLRALLNPKIPVVSCPEHINDPAFIGRILTDLPAFLGQEPAVVADR